MANALYDTLFGRHVGLATPFLHLNDGMIVTHDAFLRRAARFAHAFRHLGLAAGDRLAVQVGKSAHSLAIYAACVQSGIVYLPLNTAYTASELSYFLGNSGARLLVCDSAIQAALSPVAAATGAMLETLDANGDGSLSLLARDKPDQFDTVEQTPDDLAAILYTSGTTGRSKGAMLTQANLLSNAQVLADFWQFSDRDVLLHALPVFHTHGLFVATNVTLVAGGSMIFLPKFDLDQIIAHMPQATTMMGVPTFYTRLLFDPRLTRDLVRHMRLFISGSAPLLAKSHVDFARRTGHHILERYGMTETNMNTSNPYEGPRRAGTVGVALPGCKLKITDAATGDTLPDGSIGQIEVCGPNVFKGYWQMPEKTRAELRANGFFITGDLGKIDRHGYLQIVGRSKDLIISGGYNIYPREIEMILDKQPGVLESAVVGVPHPDYGESVVAVLVAAIGSKPDLDAINAAISESLARFKHPRQFIIFPELPRNAMGKVQKNLLREWLLAENKASPATATGTSR